MDINQYTQIPIVYNSNNYMPYNESDSDMYILQLSETIIILQRELQNISSANNVSENSNTIIGGEP